MPHLPSKRDNLRELHKKLIQVKQRYDMGKLAHTDHGICGFMGGLSHEALEVWCTHKRKAQGSWELYSGSYTYPVPDCKETLGTNLCEALAHDMYVDTRYAWETGTEYTLLRVELLVHLIEYFRELILCEPNDYVIPA